MNNRGTYALLALFFAGLCGLWLADYVRIPTARDRERARGRILAALVNLKPDDLRRIEIDGGTEPIVFERREGNRWQMTAPVNVAADPSKVETLAYNLKELARKPEADPMTGDRASFGLAPPERLIRLWGTATDAPIAALEVGKTSLDRRYVHAAGSEGVDVVNARALELIGLPWGRWRDQDLFRVPSFEVNAIDLARHEGTLKLHRDPDAWRIVGPIKALAEEIRVEGLIADLGTLKVTDDTRFIANDVKAADLDRFGLKNPALTIEVDAGRTSRRRIPQVLHVGKPVEGRAGLVYARRGDQDDVVAVDDRVLKGLSVNPNAFRSPKVADISPDRVVRIGVRVEGLDSEVARTGRDWSVIRPSVSRADRPAIQSFLRSLDQLQTRLYLDPSRREDSGLDHPSMILKIWQAPDPREAAASASASTSTPADSNGDLALTLRIGNRDLARKVIYAQIEGDERTILALPDSANDFLPRNPLAFRDHLVLAVPTEQVNRLAFTGPGRKIALVAPPIRFDPLPSMPMGWWMVEPVTAPADPVAIARLFRLLAGLRADSLVTESADDLAKYGLKEPIVTLTISSLVRHSMVLAAPEVKPGSGQVATEDLGLIVGASVPGRSGSRYAKLSDRSLIFTIGTEALGILDAEFRDRHVLAFEPSRVRRIRLDWPDRGFTMAPTDPGGVQGWSIEGAVNARGFEPGLAGSIVAACSNLTTVRYARYDDEFPAGVGLTPPRLAIRFDLDDGTTRLLRVGNPAGEGQLFATTATGDRGPLFFVPGSILGGWIKEPGSLGDLPDDVFAP